MRSNFPLGASLSHFIRDKSGRFDKTNARSLIKGWLHHRRFQVYFIASLQEPALAELDKLAALPRLPEGLELEYLFDICNLANQFSRWDEMGTALDRLGEMSRKDGDRLGLARTEYFRGARCVNRGEYRQAIGHYQNALDLAQKAGDASLQAEVLNDIGFCHRRMADDESALKHYGKSLDIRERTGDQPGQAESLNNIGLALCRQQRFAEAQEALGRAMRIEEAIGDKVGAGYTLLNLSHLASQKGEHDRAEDLCRRSLAVRREIGDQLGLGYCYINLACWARDRDAREEALVLLEQAIGAFATAGESYSQIEARLQKARYLMGFKMRDEARRELDRLEPLMDGEEPAERQLKLFQELRASLDDNRS
jgi:tetratricopeptide (TPR) repeat protein